MGLSIGSLGANLSIYIPRPVLFDYTFKRSVKFLNLVIHTSFAFLLSPFKCVPLRKACSHRAVMKCKSFFFCPHAIVYDF